MSKTTSVIIVEKTGQLKQLNVKNLNILDLYKKCGFKQPDNFSKHHTWSIKFKDNNQTLNYNITVYGKINGRANSENKYDFPPPIDNILFFGSCVLVAEITTKGDKVVMNLSLELWGKIYEKLFGGFENLDVCAIEDEEEEDELAKIPASKKTKDGYLKDGFVCDSDNSSEIVSDEDAYTEGGEGSGTDVCDTVEAGIKEEELSEEEYE